MSEKELKKYISKLVADCNELTKSIEGYAHAARNESDPEKIQVVVLIMYNYLNQIKAKLKKLGYKM